MWKRILKVSFLFVIIARTTSEVSVQVSSSVFKKCCLEDQNLIKVTENLNSSEIVTFECLSRESQRDYNIVSDPLYVGVSVEVNVDFPSECQELTSKTLNSADENLFAGADRCHDVLVAEISNGSSKGNLLKFVELSCANVTGDNETYPEPPVQLHRVRKCCPSGEHYDRQYHQCRQAPPAHGPFDWDSQLDSNSVYEVQYGLQCKYDEYAVELHHSLFTLEINGSSLTTRNKESKKRNIALPGEWCIDRDYDTNGIVAQVCTKDCERFGAFCVAKCVSHGHHYNVTNCSTFKSKVAINQDNKVFYNLSKYLNPLKVTNYREDFLDVMGVRIGFECPHGRYVLDETIKQDQHHLNHEAFLENWDTVTKDYCIETFDRRHCPTNDVVVTAMRCFLPAKETKNFRISFVVITMSCVCLALTLVVYVSLPELRNLHGRNLICHVATMLLACGCLARVQYDLVEDRTLCTALGYGIYFGFVAAFAWLNVMCFDIWWTFGSVRTVKPLRKSSSEKKRFLWYSLYAWGVPVLLTSAMYALDRYPLTYLLDANIGNGACWFGTLQNTNLDWPHYFFFVLPLGLVTLTNFVLWVLTARHCAQVKSEVHRLQAGSVGDRAKKRFRIDRAKYILTGKLWVVMGAGWISELLSTVIEEPHWLWLVVDIFNELQGVFIFIILVAKPKVYYLIKKRLGLETPDARKNATSSGRTSSTFLSRTISSDERTTLRASIPTGVKNT